MKIVRELKSVLFGIGRNISFLAVGFFLVGAGMFIFGVEPILSANLMLFGLGFRLILGQDEDIRSVRIARGIRRYRRRKKRNPPGQEED